MIHKNTNQNKGQVGIGTLIVFIAIVLVAAVAASTIIEVSGILQDRAQQTSVETISEVGDQLVVISAFGQVENASAPTQLTQISELRLNVRRSAGAEVVNLDAVTIDYDSPNEQYFLVSRNSSALQDSDFDSGTRDNGKLNQNEFDAGVTVGLFETAGLVDKSGGLEAPPRSVTSRLDRGEIAIPLNPIDAPLDEGGSKLPLSDGNVSDNQEDNPAAILEDERVQLTLSTGAGAETVTTINVPAILTEDITRLDR